jgi:hypothetical protein
MNLHNKTGAYAKVQVLSFGLGVEFQALFLFYQHN